VGGGARRQVGKLGVWFTCSAASARLASFVPVMFTKVPVRVTRVHGGDSGSPPAAMAHFALLPLPTCAPVSESEIRGSTCRSEQSCNRR
jgi:hypothetical protein